MTTPESLPETTAKKDIAVKIITWLLRWIVGATFIFSGFVKSIDPWGTLYKVNDYLAAMHLNVWPTIILVAVFLLCGYEFLTGIFLFTGSYRKSSPIMAALLMLFMLPLTLWIAIANPVPDCGCFGDAWIISNWATFWKNLFLSAAIIWLLKFNWRPSCLITPALQWLGFAFSTLFILIIALQGYLAQPFLDFRQYKVGTALFCQSDNVDEAQPSYVFIYEKDGVKKEFTDINSLPDETDGWRFIDRKEIATPETKTAAKALTPYSEDKEFHIWNKENTEEVTDSVVSESNRFMMVLMPDLSDVSIATSFTLNSMNEWCEAHNIQMIALVAASDRELAAWEDLSMPDYPIYRSEDTLLKEIARGNPAVVYVENGVIKWKNSLQAINPDDFFKDTAAKDPAHFYVDLHAQLRDVTAVYLCLIAVLMMLSLTTRFRSKPAHNPHPIQAIKRITKTDNHK